MRIGRRTQDGEAYGASFLELFYDLVFVFAITQVTHLQLEHLTWEGVGQSALILLVVWWAWQYTTWVTNELDPDSIAVRLLMIALMLAALVMAIAIPEAFGEKALLFAGSYVAIQVGRHLFLTFAAAEAGTLERHRAGQILAWFCAAGAFWIAGALAEGEARTALWLVALALDYGGPLVTFWVPWRSEVTTRSWDVGVSHMSERFGLFVIIALGESIVITGATAAGLDQLDARTVVAFAVAFLMTAALWWLYFSAIAGHFERALERADDRARVARDIYTYGHVLLIAGIIAAAVGDELVIAHPGDELRSAELTAVVAGPGLFLLAQALLRLRLTGEQSPRRLGGVAACVIVALVGGGLPALAVAGLLVAVLVGVAVADEIARARRVAAG